METTIAYFLFFGVSFIISIVVLFVIFVLREQKLMKRQNLMFKWIVEHLTDKTIAEGRKPK